MNRAIYPKDWEEIAYGMKDRAGWRCEHCTRRCQRPGEPFTDGRHVLTVVLEFRARSVFLTGR